MLGAIIGDIVGSTFEAENHRSPYFELFRQDGRFTDDSVCTVAVIDILNKYYEVDFSSDNISNKLRLWCCTYLNRGFGSMFRQWVGNGVNVPYYSYGNGALMRISPVAYFCIKRGISKEDCFIIAEKITSITHNHPEALLAVNLYIDILYELLSNKLLSLSQKKDLIRNKLLEYKYELPESIVRYRISMEFDLTCRTSILVAIAAILETETFEDVLYQVVSVGGDSDTYAAIAGAMAEAIYGIPVYMYSEVKKYFKEYDSDMITVINSLYDKEHIL